MEELQFVEFPEVECLDEIGVGRNELVLRCVDGKYKGRFFYVSTNVKYS